MSAFQVQRYLWEQDINFDCPSCCYTFKIPFQTYISDGSQVACPCCTENVIIQHTDKQRDFVNRILSHSIEL